MNLYKSLVQPLLFKLDPEKAHNFTLGLAAPFARSALVGSAAKALFGKDKPELEQQLLGLRFSNPLGLAAGMDKDARYLDLWELLGFGFVEIGSVTADAQAGNPRPRIFRLQEERALINRMGFPSVGALQVAANLERWRAKNKNTKLVIGVNIGKTKVVTIEKALFDYQNSFKLLQAHADYCVLNVSSPNTPQLRELQSEKALKELLSGIAEVNSSKRPVLIKISPDLSSSELDRLIETCLDSGIKGIIATNTSISRENLTRDPKQEGGISGPPLKQKAISLVRHIQQRCSGKLLVVGVGGIETSEDALLYLKAGASLLQIYTGLIFQGPACVSRIKRGIVRSLGAQTLSTINELIG